MYVIRNNNYDNYYQKHLFKNVFHFVKNKEEAYKFNNKREANKIYKLFKHKENIEIIKEVSKLCTH